MERKRNILIIKQKSEHLLDLEKRLICLGYKTTSFTSRALITKSLEESTVDAIIVEKIDSIHFEEIAEFRSNFSTHRIPVFLLLNESVGEGLNGDLRSFIDISKPFGYIDTRWDDALINKVVISAIEFYENKLNRLQELEKNDELLNIFLKYNPMYVFFKDKDARVIKLSENFINMLGMPANEAVGKNMFELFPSELAKSMVEDDMKILDEGNTIEVIEELHGRKYKTTKFPIIREGHHKVLAGFTKDITEEIKTEEALKVSEEKYRALFEPNRDMILLIKDNVIIDCNFASLEMLGYENKDELIGMTVKKISSDTQLKGARADEAIKLFRVKVEEEERFLFEWMLKKSNGTVFITEVMLSLLETEKETIVQALIRDITERKVMELKLQEMATTDSLTGADNRRGFNDKCEKEIARCKRYGYPLAFLMIDIDHFKVVNDTYGHFVGDLLLKQLVCEIKKDLRFGDYFARYGGEEFVAALVETNVEDAVLIAQRIRVRLLNLELNYEGNIIKYTVSIGVSELNGTDNIVAEPLKRADEAMYKAKSLGRNRVEV